MLALCEINLIWRDRFLKEALDLESLHPLGQSVSSAYTGAPSMDPRSTSETNRNVGEQFRVSLDLENEKIFPFRPSPRWRR
jgi:hypothetical protein